MYELTKIRDVSVKYNISARTLRYYEDMGLITSIRRDDYAYRLYDKAALTIGANYNPEKIKYWN